MNKKYCKNCTRYRECSDSAWSWIFLFIGIFAAVAMRLVIIFINVNTAYAKASWYIGVTFFFIFFIYRYNISRSRARNIENNELISKIKEDKILNEQDRKTIGEMLCSLTSKKEMINFAVIFILSGMTLLFAIIVDLMKIK